MPASSRPSRERSLLRWRLAVQVVFILIHVLLIKATIPNLAWAVYGLIFWGTLVYLTARTGRWVCGWVCWLGGIQDLMSRWAKARVTFNPRITQYGVLAAAVAWVPIAWLISRSAFSSHDSPVGFNPDNPLAHLLHLSLLGIVAGSVLVLGKRGACRYFCPFGIVVDGCRAYHAGRKETATLVRITPRRTTSSPESNNG